jgi:hypothetical protein
MQANPPIAFWQTIKDFVRAQGDEFLLYCFLGGVAAIIVLWLGWRLLHKRRKAPGLLPPELRIDLAKLVNEGPPAGPPVLEFYNLPMRLAGIVLAPVGRLRELPTTAELPVVFEEVLPGLELVVKLHQPLVRFWPNQVSTRGFANAFFSNVRLPGAAGKGSPWSAVAGTFKYEGAPMMIGLVLRAAAPNSLGQVIVHAEHEWLGCLRVKHGL